jgi:lipid II:glycine glycyltransferase (peptidoglycan interpeptide bridge formation enzyme)
MAQGHKNNSALKLKYKADYDKVQGFVNDFDPCGLIRSSAPIDEYDSLTNQLLSAVYNGKTRTEIKELILHEIEHHFGTPDLEILNESHKTHLYSDMEKLMDKLEQHIERKPNR